MGRVAEGDWGPFRASARTGKTSVWKRKTPPERGFSVVYFFFFAAFFLEAFFLAAIGYTPSQRRQQTSVVGPANGLGETPSGTFACIDLAR